MTSGFGTGTGFGTPQQPTTFTSGWSFGSGGTQTQQSTLFTPTQQPATGFGTQQPAQPSAFGTGTTQPASVFGTTTQSGFGTTAPQQPSAFGTGATTQSSAFGTTTQTQPPLFGQPQQQASVFGQPAATSTFGTAAQPSLFGNTQQTTPFGTGQTSAFGTGTTTQSNIFGTPQPSTGFGTTQASTFGAGTTQQTSLFGTAQTTGFGTTQQPTTFGTGQTGSSWFSGGTQPAQPSTGFGGFGTGSLFSQPKPSFTFPSFGQPQQQQQQQQQLGQQQIQPQVDEQAAFHRSIFGCCKFGDERDAILANLNYIQACWGLGKGYYDQALPPVAYNDKNILYRFKSVGYSFLFNDSNEDGQVVMHIKKPHKKVCDEESQFITSLQNMLGKPNIFFKITGSKAVNEEMTVIVIVAEDRMSLRRILATDLANGLLHPQLKPQLENLGIVSVDPKVKPSPEQLKVYLDSPPAGLDPRVWKKAQEDNPDPTNMIPIPFLGPEALKSRANAQQKENFQHYERLKLMGDEVANLQNRHVNMTSELNQLRRRYINLSHRSIMAIIRLLIVQRQGSPYLQEEEQLRRQMEDLAKQINSPTHFRGRLNELMSHVRVHNINLEGRGQVKYSVDSATLNQAKEFLSLQQSSVKHLVASVKTLTDYTQRMKEDVEEYKQKRNSV